MVPEIEDYLGHLANQVFSNQLLVKKIWRHFPVEALKSLSLVCRDFCAISRKFLRLQQFTTLAISGLGCPCQRLKTADDIIRGSTDIPFNSISLYKPKQSDQYLKFSCSDTCGEGNVEEMYPNLFKFDNWESVEMFSPEGDQNCSSLQLFWNLIFQNARSVKRVCFRGNNWELQKTLEHFIKTNQENQPLFPELVVLDIPIGGIYIIKPILLSAPKLTAIHGFVPVYDIIYHYRPIIPKGNWEMIKHIRAIGTQSLVKMSDAGMRLEKLTLFNDDTIFPESETMFQSSLTSSQPMFIKTLTKLSTWCNNVAFISNRSSKPWENLESLTFSCPSYSDPPLIPVSQCTLTAIDFDRMFPRLRKISIKALFWYNFYFEHATSFQFGVYKSSSVRHLKIIPKLSEECLAEITRIFPNVELLEVVDIEGIPMASREDLQKIFRFWGSTGNFKGLKKLKLVCSWDAVRIEDYLGYSDWMQKFGDLDFWRKFGLPPKGFSLFNKRNLECIEIHVQPTRYGKLHEVRGDTISNTLSAHAAKLIMAKMPGLIIRLLLCCLCEQCQQINDAHLEHLKPFAEIKRSIHPHGYPEIRILFEDKN